MKGPENSFESEAIQDRIKSIENEDCLVYIGVSFGDDGRTHYDALVVPADVHSEELGAINEEYLRRGRITQESYPLDIILMHPRYVTSSDSLIDALKNSQEITLNMDNFAQLYSKHYL